MIVPSADGRDVVVEQILSQIETSRHDTTEPTEIIDPKKALWWAMGAGALAMTGAAVVAVIEFKQHKQGES